MRRFLHRRRRIVLRFPLALAVLALAPAASAAVRIGAVDTSAYPLVRLTVTAPLGAPAPRVTENGHAVAGVTATNLGNAKSIMLAVDRSQSMRGRPLAQALTAAENFVAEARPDDHVGVVAFGRDAETLTSVAGSPTRAESALAGVVVDRRPGTALYDAVVSAASRLSGDARRGRAIVVVTDGRDVSSRSSFAAAVSAAHRARAAVYTIGIAGPSFTPGALERLAAATGGSYHQAANAAALGGVYASLQRELARTWQVAYDTTARPGASLVLVASSNGERARSAIRLPGVATAPAPSGQGLPSGVYSTTGTVALGVLVASLLLLACWFGFAQATGSRLRARIDPHVGATPQVKRLNRQESRRATRTRLADALEAALADVRQFKRVERMLERADMQWRAGELLVGCAAAGTFVACFGYAASGSLVAGVVCFAIAGGAPLAFVALKAVSRIKRFDNQLPDLLITMAASLKAGHSFRQGVQSVVDEGAEPAAKEFQRVLAETQLGKPMDEALADMAERIGSKNFSFVITAVTIQRQIGGSLAGLFDMVADTVRQRQQFTRKIKGLTAMGRMSAYVLVGLPFFIAGAASLLNPSYMAPLWSSTTGHELIAACLVSMTFGSVVLRQIVSFKG